jgi:hypothetical protein
VAAEAVERLPAFVAHASRLLGRQVSPEIPMAVAALDQLSASIATVPGTCRDLADVCERHASDVDRHREEVLHVGAEFLVETAAIQTLAHGLAVFTAGGSEVVGQAAQALRIASAATKIRSSLATLSLTLVTRLGPIRVVATTLAKERQGLRLMAEARVIDSTARMETMSQIARHRFTVLGGDVFRSPAGLIYRLGPSEHRVTHVLLHSFENAGKRRHSVFARGEDVLSLIDQAWLKRVSASRSDPHLWIIDMGRVIGRDGERKMVLIVVPRSKRVVTAYPTR